MTAGTIFYQSHSKTKTYLRFATICDKYSPPRYIREIKDVGYSKDVTFLGDNPEGRDCIIIDDLIDTVRFFFSFLTQLFVNEAGSIIKKQSSL